MAEFFRSNGQPVDAPALAESNNRCQFITGLLGCLLLGSLTTLSGCASVTSRIPDLPSVRPDKGQMAERQRANPPLANPEDQSLQIALETARLAEERSMDSEAIAAYEKVRQLDPNQPGVSHALAVLYDRAAKTDAAQREYTAALAESPHDVNVLCDYGYFLHSTGDIKAAEQTLRQAIANDATHRQSNVNLAVVLATQRKYDESEALFAKAIGPAAALHNIGMFKLQQGETMQGQQLIAAARDQDPSIVQADAVLKHVSASHQPRYIAESHEGIQR